MFKYTKLSWERFLFMSLRLLILYAPICSLSGVLMANPVNSQPLNEVKVDLKIRNAKLIEVFSLIEKQTTLKFTWPAEIEDINGISITSKRKELDLVLQELAKKASISFKRVNEMIAVSKVMQTASKTADAFDVNISGSVIDGETKEPLPGVSILVKGTTQGTSTDAMGKYSLNVPDDKAVLIFSFVGYRTEEVIVGSRNQIDLEMITDAQSLKEVVVTALGVEQEKKALGYAVQEVNGNVLTQARETNTIRALAGKIAGANVVSTSNGVLGSTRITLRGENSLDINKNQPLFVVDGIPINNNITGIGGSSIKQDDLPVDFGNGAGELNPDDIESISVLKGPSASALYGSRAANGVIIVTTKNGQRTKGVGFNINSNTTFETVLRLPDYQNEYGAGTEAYDYYSYGDGPDGPATNGSGYSYGPRLDQGQQFVQFGSPLDAAGNRIRIPWKSHPDNVKEYFQTGYTLTNSVAIRAGGEKVNFRLGYTNLDRQDVVPNSELKRNTISLAAGLTPIKKLSISTNLNYINSASDNVPTTGYGSQSVMYSFLWYERNADTKNWFRNYWIPGKENIQQNYNYGWADNVYFVAYEHLNGFMKDRLFGNVAATYSFTEWLSLMVRTGMDFYDERRTFQRPYSTVTAPKGRYREQTVNFREMNTDFLLTYKQNFGQLEVTLSAGGNLMKQDNDQLTVTAKELGVPGIYNLGNASGTPEIIQSNYRKKINSLYGLARLNFRDWVYMDLTGRNDWSSTLPSANNSYFYPSVSVSAVVSDILDISNNSPLSFAKLRFGWAQVGNDTDPYRLTPTYQYGSIPGSVTNQDVIVNPDLKPEIATSFETGTDLQFFNGRLGVDFTYYQNVSKNQILQIPVAITTGYTTKILNAGKIKNQGLEVVFTSAPIRNPDGLNWDIMVNFARNRSRILELADGIPNYVIAQGPDGITVEARVGNRMGDLYGKIWQRSPAGEILYDKNGRPLQTADNFRIGNYQPDWMAGIYNTFAFKGFSFGFLFDHRKGGRIYSYTYAVGHASGVLEETVPLREQENIVAEGVTDNGDGTYSPNTVAVNAREYYGWHHPRGNLEANSFDASYVKLREVKFGYTFSNKKLGKLLLRDVTLSLVGRNLLLFTNVPHIDPETSAMNGGTIVPGMEVTQLPSSRSMGVNLSFSF